MKSLVKFNQRLIGNGQPAYIVAEIGINHNGDINIAKRLIDAALQAGCDAVKFQKRTPELCVPLGQRNIMRETPWGYISYMEYRQRVEFGYEEYLEIDKYCKERGIEWSASCWDIPAVDFLEQFDPSFYKIQSAAVTDINLLEYLKKMNRPLVLSTGMSTLPQIRKAVSILGNKNLIIAHSTSTYPCPPEELNLLMIKTLQQEFNNPIGYSGHEAGLPTTVAARALGACYIERHITLDRSMWGSDQSASVEPAGFQRLVHYIRTVESAFGEGIKMIYPSEIPVMKRLRKNVPDE